MAFTIKTWNIEGMTGYKPITTFYEDFSIADNYGVPAVEDTFERAFGEWKTDYKFLTELVMALNWKIWEHYDGHNERLCKLYDKLWRRADEYAMKNLKGEELDYFLSTTD